MTDLSPHPNSTQAPEREQIIDAINQVFALFRLNFHAQFFKAFTTETELTQIKKLWFGELSRFRPEVLLKAAKTIIETSDYLPTLHTMIRHCKTHSEATALPDAHMAYLEACRAPSPKAAYRWSHPLVYHAGKRCDWYFLQHTNETSAYPIFKKAYDDLAARYQAGERFDLPNFSEKALYEPAPLSKEDNKIKMASLRESLDL